MFEGKPPFEVLRSLAVPEALARLETYFRQEILTPPTVEELAYAEEMKALFPRYDFVADRLSDYVQWLLKSVFLDAVTEIDSGLSAESREVYDFQCKRYQSIIEGLLSLLDNPAFQDSEFRKYSDIVDLVRDHLLQIRRYIRRRQIGEPPLSQSADRAEPDTQFLSSLRSEEDASETTERQSPYASRLSSSNRDALQAGENLDHAVGSLTRRTSINRPPPDGEDLLDFLYHLEDGSDLKRDRATTHRDRRHHVLWLWVQIIRQDPYGDIGERLKVFEAEFKKAYPGVKPPSEKVLRDSVKSSLAVKNQKELFSRILALEQEEANGDDRESCSRFI